MIQVNIQDAKAHLSAYLRRLAKGEHILLCNRNQPIAEIRPLPRRRTARRPIGIDKGRLRVPPAFFEPLPPEILAGFGGQSPRRR
jgi:antitoxin (DNA-binding transcriptional repressor) of toxin-antitoxin stability system